jgi:hypothetical protein
MTETEDEVRDPRPGDVVDPDTFDEGLPYPETPVPEAIPESDG